MNYISETLVNSSFTDKALDEMDTRVFILSFPDLRYLVSNKKNNAFLETFTNGLITSDNVLGYSFFSMCKKIKHPEFYDFVKSVGIEKQIKKLEKSKILDNELSKYYSYIFTPLTNENGDVNYIVGTAFDITKEILYNEKLEELNNIREEFFISMSHEFKTPVTVILSAIQMILKYRSESNVSTVNYQDLKHLSTIRQNGYRLLRLINNLLDISRINSGYLSLYLKEVDIVKFLKNIVRSVEDYISNSNLKFQFECNLSSKNVYIDADKVEKIILNLLSNAIKFTPPGKSIKLKLIFNARNISIIVEDEGIGVPKDKLSVIFDKFTQLDDILTRKSEGSGIGLALVKALVDIHNGQISVKSKVGVGSKFTVTIPYLNPYDNYYSEFNKSFNSNLLEAVSIELSDIYSKSENHNAT